MAFRAAGTSTGSVLESIAWGRPGFDGSFEAPGACRGAGGLVTNPLVVIANDNYALAA